MLLAWHIKEHLLTTQKKPQPAIQQLHLNPGGGCGRVPYRGDCLALPTHNTQELPLRFPRGEPAQPGTPSHGPPCPCALSSAAWLGNSWLGQAHSPRAKIRMTRIYSPAELKGEQFACLAPSSQPDSVTGTRLSFRSSHSQSIVGLPACAWSGLLPCATLQKNGETQPLCCYDSSNLHRFMGHNRSVT